MMKTFKLRKAYFIKVIFAFFFFLNSQLVIASSMSLKCPIQVLKQGSLGQFTFYIFIKIFVHHEDLPVRFKIQLQLKD